MPRHALHFLRRLRQTEEDLKAKAQMYHINETTAKPPSLRKNTKLWQLVNLTYMHFYNSGSAAPVRSTEMTGMVLNGVSKPTVQKIKEILQITSFQKEGLWYWRFPMRAPDEARKAIHDRLIRENNPYADELQARMRPAAETLKAIMEHFNYRASNTRVKKAMEDEGYKPSVAVKVKSQLGIVTSRRDGHATYWLYAGPVVLDWLTKKLSNGPQLVEKLELDAKNEMDWEWELIILARQILGGITLSWLNGDQVWTDVNRHTVPTSEPDNLIEVDFSDEEDQIKTKIVNVGGIKMEVFE